MHLAPNANRPPSAGYYRGGTSRQPNLRDTYTSGSAGVSEPPVTSPTSSEWSYSSNSALRRQRRYDSVPSIRATQSSQLQSTPANLSSPLPANTWASGSCSAASTCTPNVSPSTSARWQRELWSTDTRTDGGVALDEEIDVVASPHGCPSSRLAVIPATPETRAAIASVNSSLVIRRRCAPRTR